MTDTLTCLNGVLDLTTRTLTPAPAQAGGAAIWRADAVAPYWRSFLREAAGPLAADRIQRWVHDCLMGRSPEPLLVTGAWEPLVDGVGAALGTSACTGLRTSISGSERITWPDAHALTHSRMAIAREGRSRDHLSSATLDVFTGPAVEVRKPWGRQAEMRPRTAGVLCPVPRPLTQDTIALTPTGYWPHHVELSGILRWAVEG